MIAAHLLQFFTFLYDLKLDELLRAGGAASQRRRAAPRDDRQQEGEGHAQSASWPSRGSQPTQVVDRVRLGIWVLQVGLLLSLKLSLLKRRRKLLKLSKWYEHVMKMDITLLMTPVLLM